MTEQEALHIVRNPWGHSDQEQRRAALKIAILVERYRNAYENLREFAEQNGLDTTTYGVSACTCPRNPMLISTSCQMHGLWPSNAKEARS